MVVTDEDRGVGWTPVKSTKKSDSAKKTVANTGVAAPAVPATASPPPRQAMAQALRKPKGPTPTLKARAQDAPFSYAAILEGKKETSLPVETTDASSATAQTKPLTILPTATREEPAGTSIDAAKEKFLVVATPDASSATAQTEPLTILATATREKPAGTSVDAAQEKHVVVASASTTDASTCDSGQSVAATETLSRGTSVVSGGSGSGSEEPAINSTPLPMPALPSPSTGAYNHGFCDGFNTILTAPTANGDLLFFHKQNARQYLDAWKKATPSHSEEIVAINNSCTYWTGFITGLTEGNNLQKECFFRGKSALDNKKQRIFLMEQINGLALPKHQKDVLLTTMAWGISAGAISSAHDVE